jgi:hypothetical protein
MVRRILFIWGQSGQHKKILQIFLKKIKENCGMLKRSIPTREALVHSISISEVKDMKSDVLRALKASLSIKKLWTLFAGSILTTFKKEKLHRLWISFYNISNVGIDIFLNFFEICKQFYFSYHHIPIPTYWFFWTIKIKFFLIFNFLMNVHLTSLRYFQGAPAKKKTHFYWKF